MGSIMGSDKGLFHKNITATSLIVALWHSTRMINFWTQSADFLHFVFSDWSRTFHKFSDKAPIWMISNLVGVSVMSLSDMF